MVDVLVSIWVVVVFFIGLIWLGGFREVVLFWLLGLWIGVMLDLFCLFVYLVC